MQYTSHHGYAGEATKLDPFESNPTVSELRKCPLDMYRVLTETSRLELLVPNFSLARCGCAMRCPSFTWSLQFAQLEPVALLTTRLGTPSVPSMRHDVQPLGGNMGGNMTKCRRGVQPCGD